MTPLIQDYVIPMCSPAFWTKWGTAILTRYIIRACAVSVGLLVVANNISHSDPAHRYVLDRSSMAIQLAMDRAGVM